MSVDASYFFGKSMPTASATTAVIENMALSDKRRRRPSFAMTFASSTNDVGSELMSPVPKQRAAWNEDYSRRTAAAPIARRRDAAYTLAVTPASWLLASSLAFVLYTYAGYPLLCWLRARLRPRPIARRPIRPRVTVIIAAWREAGTIARKLESLARQSYPAELLDVVVACDGSDDGTPEAANAAAAAHLPGRAQVLALPERRGKPPALNAAARAAAGEVLVLTDARQPLSDNAVEALVDDLGDPEVGVAGGELVLGGDAPAGAYWKYEAAIRRWEGRAGSTVGVSGALYAIRHELWQPMPDETILDDVLQPMRARLAGRRVVFEPAAQAFDTAAGSSREFRRKVRTLSGNFQLLLLVPGLMSPLRNPSWFDFVSHKLLRLFVPYALVAAFVASALLPRPLSTALVGAQLAGYGLAGARALGLRLPLAGLAETFVVLNAAAVVGLWRFLRYGRTLPW
jgi:cellulose synthase/poly-beta-1,6-N-acetylglucosamine synthase-like glycosyltransferase